MSQKTTMENIATPACLSEYNVNTSNFSRIVCHSCYNANGSLAQHLLHRPTSYIVTPDVELLTRDIPYSI